MFLIMGLRGGADCRESLLFEHKETGDKTPYPDLLFLSDERAETPLFIRRKRGLGVVLEDGEVDGAVPLMFYKEGRLGKVVGLGVLQNEEALRRQ